MSIHYVRKAVYKVRWRQGGRNKGLTVHGSRALAEKIERKKMSSRDENRHLDIRQEVNFRMSALIDRYWHQYGSQKKSSDREKAILEGIRKELGSLFVREVDGPAVDRWYQKLTAEKGLAASDSATKFFSRPKHLIPRLF